MDTAKNTQEEALDRDEEREEEEEEDARRRGRRDVRRRRRRRNKKWRHETASQTLANRLRLHESERLQISICLRALGGRVPSLIARLGRGPCSRETVPTDPREKSAS